MEGSVSSTAGSALEELLDVSPQVDAAVVLERDGGRLVASAPATSNRAADQLAATCVRIVQAAEQARRELGREPVVQVEVATPDGHVFVVTDAAWIVAAVTDADPTVGLVFYDLKTTLRAVREAHAGSNGAARNGAAPVGVVSTSTGDDSTASGDDDSASASAADDSSSGESAPKPAKWRRRNK